MTSTEKKGFAGSSSPPKADIEQGQSQLGTPDEAHDAQNLAMLGYKPELRRNRSMFTLLFQSLAIAAVRYGPLPTPHQYLTYRLA